MKEERIKKEKGQNKKEDKKHDDYMAFLGVIATLDLLVVK